MASTSLRRARRSAGSAFRTFGGGGNTGLPGYNGAESTAGLVYMRNRWHDPNTGRFTQEEPIGYASGVNL
jgi:RHS repeat-associated protein